MRKLGCRICLCSEIDPCDFELSELWMLLILKRPVRCPHCEVRQFSWIAPVRKLRATLLAPRRVAVRYRR